MIRKLSVSGIMLGNTASGIAPLDAGRQVQDDEYRVAKYTTKKKAVQSPIDKLPR